MGIGEKSLYEIKRIDVWPVVRVAFMIGAVLGFILGLVSSLLIAAFSNLVGAISGVDLTHGPGEVSRGIIVAGAIFWTPIYGVIGAFLAAITVWIYNLMAKWAGGVRLRLDLERDSTTTE